MADLEKQAVVSVVADSKKFEESAKKSIEKVEQNGATIPLDIDLKSFKESLGTIKNMVSKMEKSFDKDFKFSGITKGLDEVLSKMESVTRTFRSQEKDIKAIRVDVVGLNKLQNTTDEIKQNVALLNESKLDVSSYEKLLTVFERMEGLLHSIVKGMNFDNIRPSTQVQDELTKTTTKLEELAQSEKELIRLEEYFGKRGSKVGRTILGDKSSEDVSGVATLIKNMKKYIELGGKLSDIKLFKHKDGSLQDVFNMLKTEGRIDIDTSKITDDIQEIERLRNKIAELNQELSDAKTRENRNLNVALDTKSVEEFSSAIKAAVQGINNLSINVPEGFTLDGLSPENLDKIISKLDEIVVSVKTIGDVLTTGIDVSKLQDSLKEVGTTAKEVKAGVKGATSPSNETTISTPETKAETQAIEAEAKAQKELAEATREVVDAKKEEVSIVNESDSKKAREYKKKEVEDDDITNDTELAKKRAEAIERVGHETRSAIESANDGVIKSITSFYDSQDQLVKMQIKSVQETAEGIRTVTSTINYDKKENQAFASDIVSMNYKTVKPDEKAPVLYKEIADRLKEIKSLKSKIPNQGENEAAISKAQVKRLQEQIRYRKKIIESEGLSIESKEKEIHLLEQEVQQTMAINKAKAKDKQNSQKISDAKEQQKLAVSQSKSQVNNLKGAILDSLNGKDTGLKSLSDELTNIAKADLTGVDTQVDNLVKSMKNFSGNFDLRNSADSFREDFVAARQELSACADIFNQIKAGDPISDEDLQRIKQAVLEMQKLYAHRKDDENISINDNSYYKLLAKMYDYKNNISGASKEFRDELNLLIAKFEEVAKVGSKADMHEFGTSLENLKGRVRAANQEVQSFFDMIKSRVKGMSASAIAQYFSFYDIIRYGKQAFEVVKEYDTALTEMRKVTDESVESLKRYQEASFETANKIGAVAVDLDNSTADYMRLGYSLKSAAQLAENTTIYANVGDMDIDTATEHMISSVQAWKSEFENEVEASEAIINRYNEIGNNYAISSADIGAAMERSAAALKAGGNNLNEALGLITAGNIIQQDAETTAAAIKILSMRVRGSKIELQEMGEEVDGVAETSSKMREEIKAISGVDIMLDENTYKSTAQQIKELGAAYKELDDVSQAALLEKIAGELFCLKFVETQIYRTYLIALITSIGQSYHYC